ncbi:hypothetical protein VV01_15360 [Luteipulveratus halotolerans]|uniref:Lipoprotein n=1 Tax=Luteipulveratus halotolerans TaxID=1631356 RepID=A0A0L6CKD8_9MICO|nr:hypothetical protein VV01_15360 [Luteipulveratus halotolerans]
MRALAGAGALGAAVLLSSCQSLSEQTTDLKYDAADGVSSSVGALQLSDVLVVTTGKGAAGHLSGMVTNNGESAAQLQISPTGGQPQTITVPPLTAVRLDGKPSGDGTAKVPAVTVPSVNVEPGAMLPITFGTGSAGSSPVQVPVLLDHPPYGTASHEPEGESTGSGEHH